MAFYTVTFRDEVGAFLDGYTVRATSERAAIAQVRPYARITARAAGRAIDRTEVVAG